MKYISTVLALCVAFSAAARMECRPVLSPAETDSLRIAELPGFGIATFLDGDSIMLVDSPDLHVIHIPAADGARQIIGTDSALYCSVDYFVSQISPDGQSLTRVAVFDNTQFSLFSASGSSFFVVTADEDWSSVHLIDPRAGVYSPVLEIDAPVRKIMANADHTFAWIGENIVAIGAGQALATLVSEPTLRDVVLTPAGIIAATASGLWLIESPSSVRRLSSVSARRLWYNSDTLYLLLPDGALVAIDSPF